MFLKKNFFQITNREADLSKLSNRVVIFSNVVFSADTMVPEVAPLRVATLQQDGSVKLRHDFVGIVASSASEDQNGMASMQGVDELSDA